MAQAREAQAAGLAMAVDATPASTSTSTAAATTPAAAGHVTLPARKRKTPSEVAPKTVQRFDDLEEFNRAANDAQPNTIYKFGSYAWETDDDGRVSHVEGRITLRKHGRKTTDGVTTVSIGQSGDAEEGDVGFHLIGDQFDGPINLLNVVPGNGVSFKELKSLNLSGYKKWEYTIAELARSRQVSVKIKLVYSAKGRRPDSITASYLDEDGNWVKKTFENKAGG